MYVNCLSIVSRRSTRGGGGGGEGVQLCCFLPGCVSMK